LQTKVSPKSIHAELQTILRRQEGLTKYTQLTLESSDFEALLDDTINLVSEVMDVDCSALLEWSSEEHHRVFQAGIHWNGDELIRERMISGIKSLAEYTLRMGQPVIVKNLSLESRFQDSAMLYQLGLNSVLSVIVPLVGKPFGVMAVCKRQPSNFSKIDADYLQSVANVLASAILRIRSETELHFSHDQLAVILEGAADGILVQGKNHELVFGNQAAAEMMGLATQEELMSTPLEALLQKFNIKDDAGNPFKLEQLPSRLVFQGEPEASAVIRFNERDSSQEYWALVKSRPILDQDEQVVMSVSVLHDITQLKQDEKAQLFLAEAGKILSSSLDYSATLNSVARLATNKLADWCAIDVIEDDDVVHHLVVAHSDPEKVSQAQELIQRYPTDWNAPSGVPKVIRTGQAEFYREINDDMIQNIGGDSEQLSFVKQMNFHSAMIMPLIARGQTFGAITLIWAESKRRYSDTDLILAEELARRASAAIDNARLLREAQQMNTELEVRVNKRTEQLHSLIATLRSEIEERQRTEEELHRSETILSTLFESAPDGHVLVDMDGNIVRVNAQVEALFGYHRGELLHKPVEYLLPERYRTRHVLHRLTYMTEPRLRTMGAGLELSARRKDGSEFLVEILLNPVRTESDTLVIAAIRDISERKQMEAELAEVQRRLIENIEAERLSLAQDLHDGPIQDLYGISYSLNALEQNLDEVIIDNGLKEALDTSKKMSQQVIDYLRSISGELRPPALAPYGLEKAIRAHIETIQQANPELEVELNLAPDGQMLPERIRLALYRIYQSAVRNVIRHAQAKRLVVRLAIDGSRVQLEVDDDGCGFELPSHWVVLARSGHFGLVGTYERVKALGGEMKIKTAPGKGTSIQVILTLSQFVDE
jgi:PAS domain S-box-containing protein